MVQGSQLELPRMIKAINDHFQSQSEEGNISMYITATRFQAKLLSSIIIIQNIIIE